jgi:Uma2 family endonuclease
MPATLTERLSPPIVQYPLRKRWTRAECERVEAAGIDLQHVELIEGELIDKMPKNRPHVKAAALLTAWLIQIFGGLRVNAEAPIDVAPEDNPTNQPVPDFIVLAREYADSARYLSTTPQPQDLDMVIEIADTSLAFDLTVKAALYARAGIAEYWVLDVPGHRLIVHRDPQNGQYALVTAYNEHEDLAPLSAPNSTFQVRNVFPEQLK